MGVFDESEGLLFNSTVVSTYFSRYLDPDVCKTGVCHTFTTLTSKPSTEVIVNFHIGGASCMNQKSCNARLVYWPVDDHENPLEISATNIPYKAPEQKAQRLIYSDRLVGLQPDTLYVLQVIYMDYQYGSMQISPFKRFRTFPNNPSKVSEFNVIFGGNIGNLGRVSLMHEVAASTNPYAAFLGGDIVFDSGFEH